MVGKLVRVNTTQTQSEEDYASQDDRIRLDDLEQQFGFRFAKAWKQHKNGGISKVGGFQGAHHEHKGTPLSYDPCPAPVLNKDGEEAPCGHIIEPLDEDGNRRKSSDMQVDAILHAEKHWKWWLEENKQTTENDGPENDGRPPKTTVINLPDWVEDGKDDFYSAMTGLEKAVYDKKHGIEADIRKENDEIKREAQANKKIRDEVEAEPVAVGATETPKRGRGRPKKEDKGEEF